MRTVVSRGNTVSNRPVEQEARIRRRVHVSGIVQGVGFRPHVYRLATQLKLGGFVANNHHGVIIEIEGDRESIDAFCRQLAQSPPPLARIERLDTEPLAQIGETVFQVRESSAESAATAQICPDIAVCDDCLAEFRDRRNRRFRYPFINCTNCGPRFTIVNGIPYDRPYTSMALFPMCAACAEEYRDPADRRFQAQPIACPDCGPRAWLHDGNQTVDCDDPFGAAGAALIAGHIVALRGLGGFHLAVDASNGSAVERLRARKHRDQKPFALMARDLDTIRRYAIVSLDEQRMLESPEHPIVLLQRLTDAPFPEAIAPGCATLGIMLPYTPLHHLLFEHCPSLLVMTSGNIADEPIAIGNEEALARLAGIADVFLLHNRDIVQRCDDSIVLVSDGAPRVIRRARGYVPAPLLLKRPLRRRILACGAELKNTIAFGRDKGVVLSQHLGDLDNPAALDQFAQTVTHLSSVLQYTPEVIACDMHPGYHASAWARRQSQVPVCEIQHHHAHLCAVMAENGVFEPTIGVILDGTGYGPDHTVWGGEILVGDYERFTRFAWLDPVPLPGGASAVREPWRMALSYLWRYEPRHDLIKAIAEKQRLSPERLAVLYHMCRTGANSPQSSSCGRLFDAVAALLGICRENAYEAQAAIALETAAGPEPLTEFNSELSARTAGAGSISLDGLIQGTLHSLAEGAAVKAIARGFHTRLAEELMARVRAARETTHVDRVGLSGGVFQNRLLLEYMERRLVEAGFHVLTHRLVPTNDGGLALGQVVAADAQCRKTGKGGVD